MLCNEARHWSHKEEGHENVVPALMIAHEYCCALISWLPVRTEPLLVIDLGTRHLHIECAKKRAEYAHEKATVLQYNPLACRAKVVDVCANR